MSSCHLKIGLSPQRFRIVTSKTSQDLVNMNAKNVCVITDKNLEKLPPMKAALDSLHANKIHYRVFSDVSIEPTDHRFGEFF